MPGAVPGAFCRQGRGEAPRECASEGRKSEKTPKKERSGINLFERQSKVEEKAVVSIEDIVNELSIIAFGDRTEIAKVSSEDIVDPETNKVIGARTHLDITDTEKLSENAKKIVCGYKMTQAGISVESCDKMKALELLGKYLGMFKDDSPTINNNIINPYSNLNEEELRKLAGDS